MSAPELRAVYALLEAAADLLKDARDTATRSADIHAALSSLANHADACMWLVRKVERP